jgi:branched-chain amino acid transport system ATP-binding protein
MSKLLELSGVHAFYGKSHILRGLDLHVAPSEIVSLIGRNGVGRSTALKAVMGLVDARGAIRFDGEAIQGLKPFQIAQKGLGYVPESRDIFPTLTVEENLLMGQKPGRQNDNDAEWGIDAMFDRFPRLRERARIAAGVLSGGEQQMLALCRTMMGKPRLILVDEPTEGLAPQVVEQVANFLLALQQRGVAVLLVEQKLAIALEISQRLYVIGHGRAVFEGKPADLRADAAIRREWLEV